MRKQELLPHDEVVIELAYGHDWPGGSVLHECRIDAVAVCESVRDNLAVQYMDGRR